MRRAVERHVEDPIAQQLLRGGINQGEDVAVKHEEGEKELTFESSPSEVGQVEEADVPPVASRRGQKRKLLLYMLVPLPALALAMAGLYHKNAHINHHSSKTFNFS